MKSALVYARLNLAVVPLHDVTSGACSCGKPDCPSGGKHPRIDAWQKHATADADVIAEWIARYPAANVGLATGSKSGFWVLDIDPDHGGAETLAALEAEHGELPTTARARTGSGGTHYLFRLPGFVVRNNAHTKIGRGIDVRGEGGQIVVAPSVSAKGKYAWVAPPWNTPIADAPAWLLELLRNPAPEKPPTPGASAENRGYFPPASTEVLAAAAAALAKHGPGPPRVNGEGGGMHAVQAAAILVHDFALTEDEAWPLLVAWNETRDPPFPHDDLRGRLQRGGKYGKAEYGCKRSMDAHARCLKAIEDWRLAGSEVSKVEALANVCRAIVASGVDPVVRKLIENDFVGATGIPGRDLELSKARPASDRELESGQIEVTPRLHEVADSATTAITAAVFQRNGVLCEVVKQERTFISDLESARIQDLMSAAATWVRFDDGDLVEQAAPERVATILHARRGHAAVRVIEAVTTTPIFLASGEILQAQGYNAQARVFLEPSVSVVVPDEPTKDDARNAVRAFADLLSDFHFTTRADFSSWLAALLTPLVKAATGNAPAPLFCISASSPGAGKTLLTEVLAAIVTGGAAEIRPYNPRDPGEWGKRLTAFVKAASPVSVFDNCNGPIGDEGLDRLITSATWSDRILGASDAPPLPNVTTWLATGNNIEPIGDTVRRVLMTRIEVDTERPQERTGFRYPELAAHALERRGDLLSAALTVLRAYHVAGRPRQAIASWGSFTAWSELVRGALVWTGIADPFLTQRRATTELNEPENEAHDFWISIVGDSGDGHAASIVGLANQRDVTRVLGLREAVTSFTLKRFLGRFIDRPRSGRRIRRGADSSNQARYFVERIT